MDFWKIANDQHPTSEPHVTCILLTSACDKNMLAFVVKRHKRVTQTNTVTTLLAQQNTGNQVW